MARSNQRKLFGVFLAAITVCSAFPTFNSIGPHPSPCDVASSVIDLRLPSSDARDNPVLFLDVISMKDALESTLTALHGHRAALLTPSSSLESNPTLFRQATRAGHTIILTGGSSPEHTEAALFESFLGYAPIFTCTTLNISRTLRVITSDAASQVLRGSAALHWALEKHGNEMDNGLIRIMSTSQLACVHSRTNCDFITPGEILWRFCKAVRSEYKRQSGRTLGSYALRRDGVGDCEDMEGFLARNRRRVGLAKEVAKQGVNEAMYVLYGMNEGEVSTLVHEEGRVANFEWMKSVRLLLGVLCLVIGIHGMVLRLRMHVTKFGCSWLMGKAADFGKIV